LSWISRCAVRTGSLAALGAAILIPPLCAAADRSPTVEFAGKRLAIANTANVGGALAIAADDPGLRDLLRKLGAAMTWKRGERYVLITTSEPRVISFSVGDQRYDVGPASSRAAFAPFERNRTVYLPFDDLMRALNLQSRRRGATIVLQTRGSASPPRSKPTATPKPAPVLPTPPPIVQATATPANVSTVTVTAVNIQTDSSGATVNVAVSGTASFDWHRLRDPDNRFWIDLHDAQLQIPAKDETANDPLLGIRARQTDPQTVRIALTLAGPKRIDVLPNAFGVSIVVGNDEAPTDAARAGNGITGAVVAATPAPQTTDESWKFGPQGYVPTNPRLIIIDPGHGGSDRGASRSGVSEAGLNLDFSKRLRDLLVARGWHVQMTRTTDVDVYAPNDSAHDELQARVDVANNAGARLFVSIHTNSFVNSSPSGTTTYYSKPSDVPFARAVQQELVSFLGTKDDGIVKSKLYVTLHSLMPAVLVETAFLSNPEDFGRLTSPQWRQKVAQAIAQGIADFAGPPPTADK
jgi:N-acetylmuramoyl-L-alanine amidase